MEEQIASTSPSLQVCTFLTGVIDHDHDASSFHSWWNSDEEVGGEEGGRTSGVGSDHSMA
jgi:hypothetical protein